MCRNWKPRDWFVPYLEHMAVHWMCYTHTHTHIYMHTFCVSPSVCKFTFSRLRTLTLCYSDSQPAHHLFDLLICKFKCSKLRTHTNSDTQTHNPHISFQPLKTKTPKTQISIFQAVVKISREFWPVRRVVRRIYRVYNTRRHRWWQARSSRLRRRYKRRWNRVLCMYVCMYVFM